MTLKQRIDDLEKRLTVSQAEILTLRKQVMQLEGLLLQKNPWAPKKPDHWPVTLSRFIADKIGKRAVS